MQLTHDQKIINTPKIGFVINASLLLYLFGETLMVAYNAPTKATQIIATQIIAIIYLF